MKVDCKNKTISKPAGEYTPAGRITLDELVEYIDIFQKEIKETPAKVAVEQWKTSGFQAQHLEKLLYSIIVKFGEGHRIYGKWRDYYKQNAYQVNQHLKDAYNSAAADTARALKSIRKVKGLGGQSYSTKVMRFFDSHYVILDSILRRELRLSSADYGQFKDDCKGIAAAIGKTPSEVESGIFAWVQILNPKQRKKRWKKYV